MYKTGVIPGKYFPPHIGHLALILTASMDCEKLIIVVSDNMILTEKRCNELGLPVITLELRAKWLIEQISSLGEVKIMDETDIPPYPEGSALWCQKLIQSVGEPFDVIFGGDPYYETTYKKNLPNVKYKCIYRGHIPISGSAIRKDIQNNIYFIIPTARSWIEKELRNENRA